MSIAEREKQILRVSQQGFHRKLDEALTSKLKIEVVDTVKTVLESALKEEVTEFLKVKEKKPYRSGYYSRGVNTQYGQISDLAVPKLRERNKEREWQILERYQRSLGNLLDWMCVLYVMGLSLRDLQEALYSILGKVLSVSAVNQITLNVQKQLESRRQVPLGSLNPNSQDDSRGWSLGRDSVHNGWRVQRRRIGTFKKMSAGRKACDVGSNGNLGRWFAGINPLRSS